MYNDEGKLTGVEVVIDKDYAGALLAKELNADFYIMATDSDAVYENWGTPQAKALRNVTYSDLKHYNFATGSMGPKVTSACWFAEKTKKKAAIGAITDLEEIITGKKGTLISPDSENHIEVFGRKIN